MERTMTVTTEDGEVPFTLAPDGRDIGYVAGYGPVYGHCTIAGEVWRDYRHHADVRRAFRAFRRWRGGPLRMTVTVEAANGSEDTCEVYGWRAALTAVRAMRAELDCDRRWYRPKHVVLDSVLYQAARRASGMDD